MKEDNFASRWYQYGQSMKDDPFVQFMMYWITFNWFYKECQVGSEKANIKAFCKKNYKVLSGFDALSTQAFSQLEKLGICAEYKHVQRRGEFNSWEEEEEAEIEALLIDIYRVRCNLFHGSKKLDDYRDQKVVEAAAEIMDGYLNELIMKKRPKAYSY